MKIKLFILIPDFFCTFEISYCIIINLILRYDEIPTLFVFLLLCLASLYSPDKSGSIMFFGNMGVSYVKNTKLS